MPLPFLAVGAVLLATGGFGLKKLDKAKDAYDEAKKIVEEHEQLQRAAQAEFDEERVLCQGEIRALETGRATLASGPMDRFIALFRTLKNVEAAWGDLSEGVLPDELRTPMQDFAHGEHAGVAGARSAAGGAVAGAIAGGAAAAGTAAFATASTGAAIGGLAGAAATNATLAWLGGGSLAAGGFGMAGGMAMLGGLVTAPLLAVGGSLANSAMQKRLAEAEAFRDRVRVVVRERRTATKFLKDIRFLAERFLAVLVQSSDRMSAVCGQLARRIREHSTDVRHWDAAQRQWLRAALETYKFIKELVETPLLIAEGQLNPHLPHALRMANELLPQAS